MLRIVYVVCRLVVSGRLIIFGLFVLRVVSHLLRFLLGADCALDRDCRVRDPGRQLRLSRTPDESPQN